MNVRICADCNVWIRVMGYESNWETETNVCEMKCLRSMTSVSQLDRVRNEVERARTGVRRELAARVDMKVLRWFGHVERMDNEWMLKKVMNAKVDGRNARGNPVIGLDWNMFSGPKAQRWDRQGHSAPVIRGSRGDGIYEATQVVEDRGGWTVLLQQCQPNSAGSLVIASRTE